MRNSPFQLVESFFHKVYVEHKSQDTVSSDETKHDKMDLQFFDQIEELTDFWEDGSPTETADRHTYRVTLGVRTAEDSDAGVYNFEVIASGVVACMKEDAKWTKPTKELVHEYGKTLLFGMIREQLANTTSRMLPGVRLLPVVNFLSARKRSQDEEALSDRGRLSN